MATKVVMAQLSPTMEEGKVVEWKVSEGDEVSQGDVVAEIETDKANMDVEAMGSGVLRKIVVPEGKTAPVGALIGVIAEADEDISPMLEEAGEADGSAPTEAAQEEAPEAAEESPEAEVEESEEAERAEEAEGGEEEARERQMAAAGRTERQAEPRTEKRAARREAEAPDRRPEGERAEAARTGDGRVKASPVARKIASDLGLDLRSIAGSGPAGRIVKADVEAESLRQRAGVLGPSRLREEVEEASPMRKTIARRLAESLGPIPHFFLTTEIDMGRALELRASLNERLQDGKVGVNDLLLKATAEALVRHPECNASWEEDAVRYHGSVDLGIAVAVEQGLITPVLRDADRKGLRQISEEARELIGRARERKLKPEEYQGATFSVSNLGMYEIDEFTAVINPPEAGILAVGRTAEKAVVRDGQVVVRQRMRVTMSCDHRVIDGATGAEFLATFKAMLENPLEMLL